jgi:hypothetical protein
MFLLGDKKKSTRQALRKMIKNKTLTLQLKTCNLDEITILEMFGTREN